MGEKGGFGAGECVGSQNVRELLSSLPSPTLGQYQAPVGQRDHHASDDHGQDEDDIQSTEASTSQVGRREEKSVLLPQNTASPCRCGSNIVEGYRLNAADEEPELETDYTAKQGGLGNDKDVGPRHVFSSHKPVVEVVDAIV